MLVSVDLGTLKRTRWYEYALRFVFGGAVTVATGIIAKRYGPIFGGLFLAFPAIFPASATLVEKHETEKKRRSGIADDVRGTKAAAIDARGAAMGALGLVLFAMFVWQRLTTWNSSFCLLFATSIWAACSVTFWWADRNITRVGRGS